MKDHTQKRDYNEEEKESQQAFSQQGKTPEEVQADLLAGEPDDLAIDFTNTIDYR